MDGSFLAGMFLVLLIAVVYFLPLWVAAGRKCKAGPGIAIVNIFLGWTFIGWVVALAWAVSGEVSPRQISPGPL